MLSLVSSLKPFTPTPSTKPPSLLSSPKIPHSRLNNNPPISGTRKSNKWLIPSLLLNTGLGLALLNVGPAIAEQSPSLMFLELTEPSNALSLPTWAVHVSSVVEWIIAMVLVWQYGQRPGNESWQGLTWGMVPLLGGAMCACTWHFFYNSESLEVLVALQAALTFFGNATLCIAAYRIYKSQKRSENI